MANSLNYHHLLYFWTVVREGGVSKAAEKLHLSQPAISAQIKTLEAALGERLFQRQGRTLVLTDVVPELAGVDEEDAILERDAALRALEVLTDAERTLLSRAYFRGMTAREISEADSIPLGTVKTSLRAAMIKLRRANLDKERP